MFKFKIASQIFYYFGPRKKTWVSGVQIKILGNPKNPANKNHGVQNFCIGRLPKEAIPVRFGKKNFDQKGENGGLTKEVGGS